MNTCNLFLVWALRASARSIRRHTLSVSDTTKAGTTQDRSAMGIDWDEYGAGSAFQDRDETGSATVCDSDLRSALPTFTFDAALKSKDHESLTAFAPSRQDLELKRLAADLTITIPCLLAMVTVMVVGLGVIINKQFDNITWPIQELVSLNDPDRKCPYAERLTCLDDGRILLDIHYNQYAGGVLPDCESVEGLADTASSQSLKEHHAHRHKRFQDGSRCIQIRQRKADFEKRFTGKGV